MFDTHTHLNFEVFSNSWEQVVVRARQAGVQHMLVVGTDVESSRKAIMMAEKYDYLYAAVGIHPHHVKGYLDTDASEFANDFDALSRLVVHEKVVAVGEVGLDYHIYRRSSRYPEGLDEERWKLYRRIQREVLLKQVDLADSQGKPLILHSREAGEDVLEAMLSYSKHMPHIPAGVFHCFDGSKKYLSKILQAGFLVSFTGAITKHEDRLLVSGMVPIDRLLLETDSPFMSPLHWNGYNEPASLPLITKAHAQHRHVTEDEIGEATSKNALKLFGL